MEEINLDTSQTNHKKFKKSTWIIIATVSIIAFIACFFIIDPLLTNESKPKLQISETSMSVEYNEYLGYTAKIAGIAKNISGKSFSYASVEFSVYDDAGNNLGTAIANINNLSKGDTWNFEATLISFPNTRPTKYKLVDITTW